MCLGTLVINSCQCWKWAGGWWWDWDLTRLFIGPTTQILLCTLPCPSTQAWFFITVKELMVKFLCWTEDLLRGRWAWLECYSFRALEHFRSQGLEFGFTKRLSNPRFMSSLYYVSLEYYRCHRNASAVVSRQKNSLGWTFHNEVLLIMCSRAQRKKPILRSTSASSESQEFTLHLAVWLPGFLFPSCRMWRWKGLRIYKVPFRPNIVWNWNIYNPVWKYRNLSMNLLFDSGIENLEQKGSSSGSASASRIVSEVVSLTFSWGVPLSFPGSQLRWQLEAGAEMVRILTMSGWRYGSRAPA
jgi:hypothetical protein